MTVIVTIYKPVLDNFLNNPLGPVGKYMFAQALKIQQAARAQVGVDTGKLKMSIHIRRERMMFGQKIEVGSPLNYALMHHEGTKPHVIMPSRAKVLRFSAGGRVIYTNKVNHPGTRPNRYLSDNLYLIR